MIHNLKSMIGYKTRALNDEIGEVSDFYFDDFSWTLRYLVVDTTEKMDNRIVLLSPVALLEVDYEKNQFVVEEPKKAIAESPQIVLDEPLTRQKEVELHNYYEWPFYWQGVNITTYPLAELASEIEEKTAEQEGEPEQAFQVRSFKEVLGYAIHARDGDIGELVDFIIDDESWNILYLIVDASTWLTNRLVLVSPQWIDSVDWGESELVADLNRETIRNSPKYDPSQPLSQQYEEDLFRYYGKRK